MYIPNIDTLIVTIDIKNYDKAAYGLLRKLEMLKAKAKLLVKESSIEIVQIGLGNMIFQVFPNGSRHHAYILHNDLYEIKLAQYRSNAGDSYPVFLKIKSACLWNMGFFKAWETALKLINDNIGEIIANKISRMDLCCHTDEISFKEEDINTFSGRFRSDEIYRSDRKLSGFTFGSGANKKVSCRIYDKTLEIKQKRQKTWFYDIWKREGMETVKVWNIEFQIERKFFKEYDIETVEQAFEYISTIWNYCTTEWIVKKDLVYSRIKRCPTNKDWKNVQKVFSRIDSKSLIKRKEQLDKDAEILIPALIGYLTTFSARKEMDDLGDSMIYVINKGIEYLQQKKKSNYEKEVKKKIALLKEVGS